MLVLVIVHIHASVIGEVALVDRAGKQSIFVVLAGVSAQIMVIIAGHLALTTGPVVVQVVMCCVAMSFQFAPRQKVDLVQK